MVITITINIGVVIRVYFLVNFLAVARLDKPMIRFCLAFNIKHQGQSVR